MIYKKKKKKKKKKKNTLSCRNTLANKKSSL